MSSLYPHNIDSLLLIIDDDDPYSEGRYDRQMPGEKGLLHWLTSTELLHTLTSSTTDLLDVINQLKVKDKGIIGLDARKPVFGAYRN